MKKPNEATGGPYNIFNPEGIKAGDRVRLLSGKNPTDIYTVESVGGRHGNKVFVRVIGHELYAACFTKVE